jgi:hypothetical protein
MFKFPAGILNFPAGNLFSRWEKPIINLMFKFPAGILNFPAGNLFSRREKPIINLILKFPAGILKFPNEKIREVSESGTRCFNPEIANSFNKAELPPKSELPVQICELPVQRSSIRPHSTKPGD